MTTLDVEVAIPTSPKDPVNRAILEVSEDQIKGFVRDPVFEIAHRSGIDGPIVVERIQAMLRAGVVRRVRQTLLATNLAQGALVAWKIGAERLDGAFDFLSKRDPFSGHVVIRNSEFGSTAWPLWTTLKVPTGFSIEKHCEFLRKQIGAEKYRIMPALRAFVLGVGHMRRKGMRIGEKADQPAMDMVPAIVDLDERDWRVLVELKRDLEVDEVGHGLWERRALEAGIDPESFLEVAESLDRRGVIGRFSTFLEHTKPVGDANERLSSFNGLFHWAVPKGREIEAGREIGRFAILTHCYWRDAGPELDNVNIMAVAHGETKDEVLAHKAAIDRYLVDSGIGCNYTHVYWGGRAEIKPSEISPIAYRNWARMNGVV
ncbi:MAG TPA: Lrp/AsnC family transcriptional regulator [Thermoanaerobaculia bacterium]|nr:Lrp/AsnC family transcriptional regulator [Thermoanaerobaculia bacterium]